MSEGSKEKDHTHEFDTHEALAEVGALAQDIELLRQLVALVPALVRFASDAFHRLRGHRVDSYRREDVREGLDELGFNQLNCDIVCEPLQRDLAFTSDNIIHEQYRKQSVGERTYFVISDHTVQCLGSSKAIHVRLSTGGEICNQCIHIVTPVQ